MATGDNLPTVEYVRRKVRAADPPSSSYAHAEYRNVRSLLLALRVVNRLEAGDGTAKTLDSLIEEESERLRAAGGSISMMLRDERAKRRRRARARDAAEEET